LTRQTQDQVPEEIQQNRDVTVTTIRNILLLAAVM
jgi:hypothetical protein